MEKKDLKMYEAPVVKIVEMELQNIICASTVDGDDLVWGD